MTNKTNTISVQVGKKLFSFSTHLDWVNTAQRKFAANGVNSGMVICVDQQGRLLKKGLEFSRADKDGAFPVDVYLALTADSDLHDRFLARSAATN
jgi:hypothetical protein